MVSDYFPFVIFHFSLTISSVSVSVRVISWFASSLSQADDPRRDPGSDNEKRQMENRELFLIPAAASVFPGDKRHRFSSCAGIVAEAAQHGRSNCFCVRLPYTAERHASVLGFDYHHHSNWS